MNMNYKEKLIILLSTDEVVREDLEGDTVFKYYTKDVINFDYGTLKEIKVHGRKLEERHLRMYLENKNNYLLAIKTDGSVIIIGGNKDGSALTICKLDNTKDFDNQSNETYKSIFEFLETLTK